MSNWAVLLVACVVAGLFVQDRCGAQETEPQYSIKADRPVTGSIIHLEEVGRFPIPINRKYDELTPSERAHLHQWWEKIDKGDEPPFPAKGLKPVFDAIRTGQERLRVKGKMRMVATVGPDGSVTQVKSYGPLNDPAMTEFVAEVLILTKFKPAVCGGRPCRMDFPLEISFRVDY